MEHLEVIGSPEMSVVAFKAKDRRRLDIFKVNDLLSKRGWHLSALQLPSALHMCFTAQHVDAIAALVKVDHLVRTSLTCLKFEQYLSDCNMQTTDRYVILWHCLRV